MYSLQIKTKIGKEEMFNTCDDIYKVIRETILDSLEKNGVVILPPMDVRHSLLLFQKIDIKCQNVMIDPWYNKGVGGIAEDYESFIRQVLTLAAPITEHIYLWGFPEIVANFVRQAPDGFELNAWLTWYYKNCPSVIRGWRSAQNACLHFSRIGASVYPENFLTEAQLEKMKQGKLRYMPGPPSVIEAPLNIGFVGKNEQTGHPSQKPEKVYEVLLLMVTKPGDLVIDPMAGSGTTGSVSKKLNRKAILCDISEEYTQMMEKRLGVKRMVINGIWELVQSICSVP